jgi:HD-like signal output (HDOD) protein/ActR/RegA family two-component response regulator
MKILIVDDEFVSRTKLKLIMENYGQCEAVEHGKDAIAIFHHAHFINEPFNLIMLDINLPEMNGIMVLSEIRRAEKYLTIPQSCRVKILMVTSYGDKDRIVASAQSGCDDFIVKPFNDDIIREKLVKLGIIEPQPSMPPENNEIANPPATGSSLLVEEIYSFLNGREVRLPSLPRIQAKFREMISTGAAFQQISNLLKNDVAISVELIRMSNSAFYRGVKKNKSLEQAIARLGYAAAEQVVKEMLGRNFFSMKSKKYRHLIEQFWKHSLACAYASEITSKFASYKLSEDLFSMGLLHDIGKLALLQIIAEIEQRANSKGDFSTEKLVNTINDHHCFFGAKILEKWKYAESYVNCAHYHSSLEPQEDDTSTEHLIVHFSNLVAKSLGYDFSDGTQTITEIELEHTKSGHLLKLTPHEISETRAKVEEEMKGALELL